MTVRGPVRLRIDRLTIDGSNRPRAEAVAAALKSELKRLLGDPATQARLRRPSLERSAPPQRPSRAPELSAADRPERTGRRLATQVTRTLLTTRSAK
jgi:hypothetical protein